MKTIKENLLQNNYWQERQKSLQNPKGKQRALKAAFEILCKLKSKPETPLRILELGCGEGHILGDLLKLCNDNRLFIAECVGIDNQLDAIVKARKIYPQINFFVADYASKTLDLEPFDLIMFIGTLHEVYSSNYSIEKREIDEIAGQKAVINAISNNLNLIKENGIILLFDGVEHSHRADTKIIIRFQTTNAFLEFKKFATEYKAFQVKFKELKSESRIKISLRDFTRYITKTRFINSNLWEIEKWESYQYFRANDFRKHLCQMGVQIFELSSASPNQEDWESRVLIETPGINFPYENILIVGQKSNVNRDDN